MTKLTIKLFLQKFRLHQVEKTHKNISQDLCSYAGVQVLIFPGIISLTFVFAQQVMSRQMLQAELN